MDQATTIALFLSRLDEARGKLLVASSPEEHVLKEMFKAGELFSDDQMGEAECPYCDCECGDH